jgi:hypothetical protein
MVTTVNVYGKDVKSLMTRGVWEVVWWLTH